MVDRTSLADIFPRFSEADWRAAVERTKRGVDSGAESRALFPRRTGARAAVGAGSGQPWVGVSRVDAATAADAIAGIRTEVDGGATGVAIATAGNTHPLGGRLPKDAATAVLASVPEHIHVRIETNDATIIDAAAARGRDLVVAFDPVAAIAVGAATAVDEGRLQAAAERNNGTIAIADGRPWHAGGATDEQELGIALATFVHHVRRIDGRIDVTLVADADQFRTIAKFRAMRLLLARIGEVAGIEVTARIHAETAWRSMSARDPNVNILRATGAVFGAAVGGADSITVLPFDVLAGRDEHGRRLARNTQIILAEEAQLYRVADPGAGSGAIEAMTDSLAEAAWARFQDIESEGGIVRAIQRGGLLRDVAEARDARLAQAAAGMIRMVGINAYAGEVATPTVARSTERRRLVFTRVAEAFET